MLRRLRITVALLTIVLFIVWAVSNLHVFVHDPGGVIRLVLGFLFAMLIMFRWKPEVDSRQEQGGNLSPLVLCMSGVAGVVLFVSGKVLDVGQFQWMGLILLMFTGLSWSLPRKFTSDITAGLFLLYWMHPMPGQVFGPLQFFMQKLSVKGAELLLHSFNIRVWADGMVLYTGARVFMVPESCSGMVTAVTVLICTIGIGILMRFKWYETVVLVLVGLFQVLCLNIVRIGLMVALSPRMPLAWSESFLHDNLGIFLLVSILVSQAEAAWWRTRKVSRKIKEDMVENKEVEPEETGSILPRFWHLLYKWMWVVTIVMVIVGSVSFACYKRRMSHRLAMVSGIVEELIKTDSRAAERAAVFVLAFKPSDRAMRFKLSQALAVEKKYGAALWELERLEAPLSPQETVLKSWVLTSLKKHDEAMAIIEGLPSETKSWPYVAIVRAEYAAKHEQPREVAQNVVVAARYHGVVGRVRQLYQFLAFHEQWQSIIDSDNTSVPYAFIGEALVVIDAHFKTGRFEGAAEVLKKALEIWPDDPRLLNGLFTVAQRIPGGIWEDQFARGLSSSMANMGMEELTDNLGYCFRLNRPDLAWKLFVRMQSIDSRDPALYEAVARYGPVWFTFRNHHLGLSAVSEREIIDLRVFCGETRHMEPFSRLWDKVPLVDELFGSNLNEVRKKYFSLCLSEIERRRREGVSSKRIDVLYPSVLAMVGRFNDAHKALTDIDKRFPDRKWNVLFQRAVFYNAEGRWQESYDALRQFMASRGSPGLSGELLFVNALINMNLGVYALEHIEEMSRKYPDAPGVTEALAAVWNVFGFEEEALFVLEGNPGTKHIPMVVQSLYNTGRVYEAERMSKALGVRINKSKKVPKGGRIAPAEHSVSRMWGTPLTGKLMDERAQRIEEWLAKSERSFIKTLMFLESSWYRKRGKGAVSDASVWEKSGRDDGEKAAALHRLAGLLAKQKEYKAAAEVLKRALALLPESQVLWRMLVAVTKGDADVVNKAAVLCPDDPEIWLATLILRAREYQKADKDRKQEIEIWLRGETRSAVSGAHYSVGTLVRAGDLLRRAGFSGYARDLVEDAIKRARGFLPAHILGLQCAFILRDSDWGLACAKEAIRFCEDPGPFYRVIVDIKSNDDKKDAELVSALEYLREHYSNDLQWSERLGAAYFERGNRSRALSILAPVIDKNFDTVQLPSLLLAAEAARQEGRDVDMIRILEKAYAMYPDKVSVLNNLVYGLMGNRKTLERARQLLPGLLEMAPDSFVVLDTAAMVYLKSDRLDLAEHFAEQAMKKLDMGYYAATEVKLNYARILVARGKYEEAQKNLDAIMRGKQPLPMIESEARRLLAEIKGKKVKREEVRSQRSEVRGQKSEVRSQRSEVRGGSQK